MTDQKPRAWMRRWSFDGELPLPGKRMPAKFRLLAVTIAKALPDDVPLYSADDLGVLADRAEPFPHQTPMEDTSSGKTVGER